MEFFANTAETTLTANVASGDASIPVAAAALFPTSGNFRVLVDSELMLVTSVNGLAFAVTRGIEGTTATTHAQGATVTHTITAGGLTAALGGQSTLQAGTATLGAGGNVTVTGVSLTASSKIQVTRNTASGTLGNLSAPSAQRNVGSSGSFEIVSDQSSERSTVDWFVVG
jgi:hypothetical protein